MNKLNPNRKKILLIITTYILGLIAHANHYANDQLKESFFQNYSTDNGLPHQLVYSVEEDSRGFIWLGTQAGLVRYDGIYFDLFNDQNSKLFESNISALHQSKDNHSLWVGTINGTICRVNIDSITFHPLQFSYKNINPTGIGEIKQIHQYNDSILLLTTSRNGLLKINIHTGTTAYVDQSRTSASQSLMVYNIKMVFGTICIASREGIFAILQDHDTTLRLKPFAIGVRNTTDLTQETDSTVLVAVSNMLYRYNIKSNKAEYLNKIPDRIQSIISLPSKNIWLATRTNGMYYYDTQLNTISHYTVGNSKYNLQDNNIYTVIQAKNTNIIWIGTKNGLTKLENRQGNIRYFDLNQYSDAKSANLFMIKYDRQDNFWIWSTDGLYRKNSNQNKFEKIKPSSTYSNNDTILHAIETKNDGLLFASTRGILQYTPHNQQLKYLSLKSKNSFYALAELNDNSYCFLSTNLFVTYNSKTKTERSHYINNYQNIRLQTSSMEGDSILWIGSNHGILFRYCIKSAEITDTIRIPANEKIQTLSSITAIQTDSLNNLWIATQGSGLFKYSLLQKRFSAIKTSDQNSENIYIIEKDRHGNLWLSNSLGIIKLNPATGTQTAFSYNYYILSQEFNKGASDITPSGKILMGGANGFNEIDPDRNERLEYEQNPIITSCILLPGYSPTSDRNKPKTIYNPQDTIIISKAFESIRLYVRFLNYASSRKEKIAWKIDQLDSTWHKSSLSGPIIYYNIPPGNHRLTIMALDDNNNLTGKPLHITIVKEVYFYRHPAFKPAVAALIFLLLFIIFFMRNKSLVNQRLKLNKMVVEKTAELVSANQKLIQNKEKITSQNNELMIHRVYLEELVKIRTRDLEMAKQKAEESDKLKTAFLANLSHEIRTPMNSIIGFTGLLGSEIFSQQEKDEFIQHIHSSSESLLALISDIIDISRIETGLINIVHSKLNIEYDLTKIVHSLQFEKTETISEIKLNFDISCNNQSTFTDKERFKQIVINLIKNAIKFTQNGEVALSARVIRKNELYNFNYNGAAITEKEKILLIAVDDQGIGIAPENQQLIFEPFRKVDNKEILYPGIGLGLSIVKNLTKLLEGEVWLKSEIGTGSTFYFYIPIKTEAENSNPEK